MQDDIDWLKQKYLELESKLIPKVGDYYITENENDPAERFGGTWSYVDKMLMGYDDSDPDFDDVGVEGGEKEVTLTVAQMPSHKHDTGTRQGSGAGTGLFWNRVVDANVQTPQVGDTGGDEPHNNMPPYRVVYIWRRTS